MEDNSSTRLRVLCLHGFMTNSKIMQFQTRKWRKYFEDMIDFEFLDGQYERNLDEIDDAGLKRLLQKGDQVYSWIQSSSNYERDQLGNDLNYVIEYINKEGPFDGLMGFSQGGGIVNSIIQYINSNLLSVSQIPKFFIIINAPFFHLPLKQAQIDVPTLHFVSKQDDILFDRPLLMTTFYKNPMIISHSHGHKVPNLEPQQIVDIKRAIKGIVKRSNKLNENSNGILPQMTPRL